MSKRPVLIRILAVAAIAVLILIPIGLIKGKVAERQARAEGVVKQFANEFEWPAPPRPGGNGARAWKHAYLAMLVSDPRGIKAISSSFASPLLAAASEREFAPFTIRQSIGEYAPRPAGTRLPFTYKLS